jgi:hypothetical protein
LKRINFTLFCTQKNDKYFRAGPQAILNDSYSTISILVAGNIIDAAEQAEYFWF